jgi:CRP-like cAMP-binding protein
MPTTADSATPPANRLLARLPLTESRRLRAHLKAVDLPYKKVLYPARSPVKYVYFPSRGVASAVTYTSDGSAIEVATVGDEGMLGLPALFGDATSATEVYMQVAGDGLQMSADVLRREAGVGSPLYRILVQYLSVYLVQVSQTAACNGLHLVRQRCCKWLLTTHDRVHSDELPLTHEFLSMMLGVRRPSVTEVLRPLADEGLIHNGRGKITILDRAGLEAAACECYQFVIDEFDRLLGRATR